MELITYPYTNLNVCWWKKSNVLSAFLLKKMIPGFYVYDLNGLICVYIDPILSDNMSSTIVHELWQAC